MPALGLGLSISQVGMLGANYAAAYHASVLADTPSAYWRLGEASGTTAADETGTYPGTYVGSPTLGASGIFPGNTAVTFNATTTKEVTIPLASCAGTSGSVEAWVKPIAIGGFMNILSSSATANIDHYWRLDIEPTGRAAVISFDGTGSANALYGNTVMSAGTWYHIVAVSDGSNTKIYVNGILQTITISLGANIGEWFGDIAGRVNAKISLLTRTSSILPFNGVIDEVALYSGQLSAARVLAHYNASGR